jgi:hypothetical protein
MKLATVAKDMSLFRFMRRFNPQIGTYGIWNKVTVTRVNKATFMCSDGKKYSKETGEVVNSKGVYGDVDYVLTNSVDEAKKLQEQELANGVRIQERNQIDSLVESIYI